MPQGQSKGTGGKQPKEAPKNDVPAHPRLKGGRKKGTKTAVSFHDIYKPCEKKRAEVLARAVARRAAQRPELKEIRKRLFDGKTLAAGEASRLVGQAGLRHFDSNWYKKEGIPIISHRSYYIKGSSRRKLPIARNHARIVFEWNGRRRTVDPAKTDGDWWRRWERRPRPSCSPSRVAPPRPPREEGRSGRRW